MPWMRTFRSSPDMGGIDPGNAQGSCYCGRGDVCEHRLNLLCEGFRIQPIREGGWIPCGHCCGMASRRLRTKRLRLGAMRSYRAGAFSSFPNLLALERRGARSAILAVRADRCSANFADALRLRRGWGWRHRAGAVHLPSTAAGQTSGRWAVAFRSGRSRPQRVGDPFSKRGHRPPPDRGGLGKVRRKVCHQAAIAGGGPIYL
jgi:hypothetical protein